MMTSHAFVLARSLLNEEIARRPELSVHRRALTVKIFETLSAADVDCSRTAARALAADVIRAHERQAP